MGLDISQIKNSKLMRLAYTKDADCNGKLDEKEFSIFRTEAMELKGVSDKALKNAMGLYISEPTEVKANDAQLTDNTQTTRKVAELEVPNKNQNNAQKRKNSTGKMKVGNNINTICFIVL